MSASNGSRQARRSPWPMLALAGALLLSSGALALVAARSAGEPVTLDARAQELAESLRCPVCQNLSVADSPSALARQMRAEIAEGLREGQTPEEIRARFVEAYGEWVLLAPPRRGIDLLAWILPAALLAGGVAATGFAVRRWVFARERPLVRTEAIAPGAEPPDHLSAPDRRLLEDALFAEREEPE